MTIRSIGYVGQLSMVDFDARCRRIVAAMAGEVARSMPDAIVGSKPDYSGRKDADVFTTADLNAQTMCVQMVDRLLPRGIGLIGEEAGLRRPSTLPGRSVVITVDPGDGTRRIIEAIKARRSLVPGEVSSMLGVQIDGVPIGSYICDVASRVTYVKAPYGDTVSQVTSDGVQIDMSSLPRAKTLRSGILMHHGRREVPASPLAHRMLSLCGFAVQRELGSVGLSVMRVLSGEFTAMLRIAGGYITPWDDTPILAACKQSGVVPLVVFEDHFEQLGPVALNRAVDNPRDILYISVKYLSELHGIAPVVRRG